MTASFLRKKENFKCRNCGYFVKGNGYTNHCPKCLYSEHVDNEPGDRANRCKGLMKPVALFKKDGVFHIVHKCEKCGDIKHNVVSPEDNSEAIIELSTKPAV